MLRQVVKVALATRKMVNKFQVGRSVVKIDFFAGKNWFELTYTPGTLNYTNKSNLASPGVSFEQKLKCNYTRYSGKDENRVDVWGESDLFLRLEYNTGEVEIVGCPDFPVRLNSTFDEGDSSVYKLEFVCNTIYRTFTLAV